MSFSSYTVVSSAADMTSGLAASLRKFRAAPARLAITMKDKVARSLGLADGDQLAVQLGAGEHHGLIRLRKDPEGSARIVRRQPGTKGKWGSYHAIELGHVAVFVDRSEPKKWCEFAPVDDGWIEIVLPSWADETSDVKRQRPTTLPGPHSLPAPPRRNLTAQIAGDPPPGRSALAQRRSGPEPTLGEARRAAEAREAAEHAATEAEEWNRKARDTDRLGSLCSVFGITRAGALIITALLDGRLKSRPVLLDAIDSSGQTELRTIDVHLTQLRKKLALHLVEIETVRGVGFRMPPASIARVTALITPDTAGRAADDAELAALDADAAE